MYAFEIKTIWAWFIAACGESFDAWDDDSKAFFAKLGITEYSE